MRKAILAGAMLVCVPAWAQTALPPQWGTSSNAAPTPKHKPGEDKKPLKLKPGKGTVTQQAPATAQPAAPVNVGPAQPASAPAPPPFIPPATQTVAAPVPTPSPPVPAAPATAKSASVDRQASRVAPDKTATAKSRPPARKKAANADLLTPAKPKPAATLPEASAAPAPVVATAPPAVASPSAAIAVPSSSAAPAPTYVAPPPVSAPVTTYYSPAAAPAPAPVNSNPAYAAPVPAYAPPSAGSAEPLPGAAVAPPPRPAPTPLPSLVEMSPRARRKAAARDAALAPSRAWIDISAPISIGVTPTYPGTAPLNMRFDSDMERGAPLDLSEFSMSNHTGTHVDAPLHFLRGAPAVDQIPLEQLCGPVLVLNIDPSVTVITAADLERYPWRGARRILFRTRNSVNEWIVDPQFHSDYTYLAPDAAELLVNGGVELVGIDYLSIEEFGAPPRTHVILLSKGVAVVEGLDLRSVAAGDYDLTLLPLKILGHEAAPARAVLRRR